MDFHLKVVDNSSQMSLGIRKVTGKNNEPVTNYDIMPADNESTYIAIIQHFENPKQITIKSSYLGMRRLVVQFQSLLDFQAI